MVSKKKAQGKARKAPKAKAEEKKEDSVTAQQREQDASLEAQMQRLLIDVMRNDNICRHGYTHFRRDTFTNNL